MKNKGFTIIELLAATVVFSLVLLMALAGILQITKMYYKGVNQARTQDVARTVVDEIAETLRYTNASVDLRSVGNNGIPIASGQAFSNHFCIGSKRYSYAIDRKLTSAGNNESNKEIRHVLWVDTIQPPVNCDSPADLTLDAPSSDVNGRELVAENMRLVKLDINRVASLGEVFNIDISVAYGDDDTQNEGPLVVNDAGTNRVCLGYSNGYGGEFCAVSSISTTAERRLQ